MLANLNDVLKPAREEKYAVGLFNTVNLEMARGVISAAEELNAPVIIGTAEILFPYGPLEELSYLLIPMAKKASVPVVLHLDHGLNEKTCRRALELGYSSIMYDCSMDSFENNIKKVKEMAKLAHSYGASIEAELGHVGDNEGSVEGNNYLFDPSQYYTQPQQAKEFVEATNADALAIAAGSAHGAYKLPPKLDFERIRQIADVTDIPLVLHGGSGLLDSDFQKAIDCGISKVNIFTDINQAGARAAHEAYQNGLGITDLIEPTIESIKVEVMKKILLFKSNGKA